MARHVRLEGFLEHFAAELNRRAVDLCQMSEGWLESRRRFVLTQADALDAMAAHAIATLKSQDLSWARVLVGRVGRAALEVTTAVIAGISTAAVVGDLPAVKQIVVLQGSCAAVAQALAFDGPRPTD
jgi:hypothetical protein